MAKFLGPETSEGFEEEGTQSTNYGKQMTKSIQSSRTSFKKILMQRYFKSSEHGIGTKIKRAVLNECSLKENSLKEIYCPQLRQVDVYVKERDKLVFEVHGSEHPKISRQKGDLLHHYDAFAHLGLVDHTQKALRRYECTVCQKSFGRKDSLNRHTRIHSNLKPHRCGQCGYLFARLDHLKSHMRTHSERKPHGCPYCCFRAWRKDMITQHIISHWRQ